MPPKPMRERPPAPIEDASGLGPHGIRDLTVPVGPLPDRRRRRRSAVLVAVAVVAVIGGAVVASRAFPAQPSPTAVAGPSGVVQSEATPAATRYPWSTPAATTIGLGTLVAGSLDGTLEGNLVLLTGRIAAAPASCGSGRTGDRCVTLSIANLDLPVDRSAALDFWQPPLPSQTLVLMVSSGRLVYLGAMTADIRAPTSMTELIASRPISPFPMTLVPVSGWLIVDPIHECRAPSPLPTGDVTTVPVGCPPPVPFLADDEPLTNGIRRSDRGSDVRLESGAAGLVPGVTVTGGTWLVRHGFHSECPSASPSEDPSAAPSSTSCFDVMSLGWDVVARLDGVRVLQVTVP